MDVGVWNDFSLTTSPIWLSRQAAESLRVPKVLSAAETDSLSVSDRPCCSDPSHFRVPISRSLLSPSLWTCPSVTLSPTETVPLLGPHGAPAASPLRLHLLFVSLNLTLLLSPEPSSSLKLSRTIFRRHLAKMGELWKSLRISGSFNFDEWKSTQPGGVVVVVFAAAAPRCSQVLFVFVFKPSDDYRLSGLWKAEHLAND